MSSTYYLKTCTALHCSKLYLLLPIAVTNCNFCCQEKYKVASCTYYQVTCTVFQTEMYQTALLMPGGVYYLLTKGLWVSHVVPAVTRVLSKGWIQVLGKLTYKHNFICMYYIWKIIMTMIVCFKAYNHCYNNLLYVIHTYTYLLIIIFKSLGNKLSWYKVVQLSAEINLEIIKELWWAIGAHRANLYSGRTEKQFAHKNLPWTYLLGTWAVWLNITFNLFSLEAIEPP